MENFEERYSKYLAKLKNEIPYVLWKSHHDFEYDFKHNFVQGNSFLNTIAILWWIGLSVVIPFLENKPIIRIIVFVVWLGITIWYWVFNDKHSENIADYFFYQYEYKKIIEDRIKRDEQRDIQNLLDELLNKANLTFVDLESYKLKIDDIKCFYNRCLREIKYEHFEEKIS